ncbi:HAMP domain-containing sensor histidine kinase [Flavitalea sp. BT771]|uniref:sensor histidine kinase n=1 Tax=Flavitalea sp. BT771 TaxID=3063329 RepID=UPI0026E38925|nr:HAMP domain-containing sensor histidine kinase [Flavitalea sp. BT771]MDO6430421.1 HAMP domain-containing sensor histidine kinase [Flavitalea sp. BT771]MDV6219439.1 HAMP domain-containing sensor histidine kinase [Flavitalea sp. BT771]
MMENAVRANEQKFSAIIMNAPVGILEMDATGAIVFMNTMSRSLLAPISLFTEKDNFHDLLARRAPGILEKINAFTGNNGVIFNGIVEHFKIIVNKLCADSFIVSIEDVSNLLEKELAFREATVDKAVAQGKFEIAADVLHDIGNAIVGLGSYLTRIKRAVEADNSEHIQQLADFFSAKQPEISQAIGASKAAAVVTMLYSLVQARHAQREDVQKSISEQLSIITHIQELLHIQRQYVVAGDTVEKKAANLRSIINDCLSMLYASMEKRGIQVELEIIVESPIIQGHRTKLMQVIMNVLKNSIEAIDVHAAEKRISVRLFQEGRQVILQVRDSGNGFDEDTGRRIFERGYTTKSSGTGLGLHNCRTILEGHAATMTLLSEGPGKGALSTIIFHI